MAPTTSDIYYDPYDFDIDADPYPAFARLRNERPLYYNEKHDFYAVSRFADVESCSVDWQTFSSERGPSSRSSGPAWRSPKGCSSSKTRPCTTCTDA